MLPKVILEVLRHTMIPSTRGDGDTVGWPFFEIITVVLSRDPINLLDWMIRQMLGCKQNVNAPLILQPYVMELVHHNVKNFTGSYEISHQVYWPFINNEA